MHFRKVNMNIYCILTEVVEGIKAWPAPKGLYGIKAEIAPQGHYGTQTEIIPKGFRTNNSYGIRAVGTEAVAP